MVNGVLIGAAVGGLLGLIPDYFDDCEECHDALYASIAVGAGAGLVIDLLKTHGPLRVELTTGRRALGIRTNIRWR